MTPDFFETFWIRIPFHVGKGYKYDQTQLLHEIVSAHLQYYLKVDQYT